MKVIIPMAGRGSRFQKEAERNPEYAKPKPFINVKGYPMVRWATGSLPFIEHKDQKVSGSLRVTAKDLIFIILQEHETGHALSRGLKDIYGEEITVIILPEITRGAAETAYQAKKYCAPDEDILLSDSDHYFDGTALAELILNKNPDTAGIIPVFTPPNDGVARWSYSLLKFGTNEIIQVGEKDVELMKKGAPANIGAYYFSKAKVFFDEVEDAIVKNRLTGDEGKKEFYIAPMYQNLIENGYKFQAALTPTVWGLGTPSDLENFVANCPVKNP
ncbi:MAG: hypothetical protein A3J93_01205 [Candidatus Magasanikbacteria bacterium RIFOXYC2_FULL_42_28]|uniref:Nucleotidyl transferase domain-containing protein n=1 Tax=Candidatus Magasanikbacteria bacterium RIFOXYC2_FULL_42_28 TaxID=1798704 RepID=A0A1F6NXQ9_9BACT|nr:MAG: hypothetical protein A3J93_01205 [Candidatus Magasanikbacteria bacterium RIFOXYC2_FULL_42_28]